MDKRSEEHDEWVSRPFSTSDVFKVQEAMLLTNLKLGSLAMRQSHVPVRTALYRDW